MKSKIIFLTLCFTALAYFAVSGSCDVPAQNTSGVLNVKDFGAVGDSKADDTAAIQSALDKAKSIPRGSSVILPPGEYRVTKTLIIENTLLTGLSAGGWPADRGPMPTIRVDFTDGPCIHAKDAASIHGINFEYDHKGEEARKFGPTVLLSGIGISITNVRIHQPYQGIMADGVTNIGRLNLENVFIVSARECGVYVTNAYDIPTLRNVEVWNLADYGQSHCVGFRLGKNDEIHLDNCFAFKCKIGYHFIQDKQGSTWGGMTGCSADYSLEGVVVDSAVSLRIVGGSLWTHGTALRVSGPGRVIVSGVDLIANLDAALIVRDCTSLTVTGCTLGKAGPDWPTAPAAKIEGGKSVLVSGCTFDAFGPGIVIGEKANNFSITNNIFQPSPFQAISDRSAASASKVIQGNLIKKTETEKN